MSTQAEVNKSAYQYVLYYLGVEQKDGGVWPTHLEGVCNMAFEKGDVIVCNDLSIKEYPAPTNDQLLKYESAAVLAWYDGFYILPTAISDFQYYKISAATLDTVRTEELSVGFKVFDTTNKCQRVWDGLVWVAQ